MDESHFLHGAEYRDHTGVARLDMCATCAFRPGSGVRPTDFNEAEFIKLCAGLDDFVCHTPNPDGSNPSCAVFHRLFKSPR